MKKQPSDVDCEDMKSVLIFFKMNDVMNKLTLTKGTSMRDVKMKDGELKGFNNVLVDVSEKHPEVKRFGGDTAVHKALVRQWLSYVQSNVRADSSSGGGPVSVGVLKELDEALSTTTYVVGHKMTLVDPVLYVSLYPTYSAMSLYEKEKFVNLSRWFRLMQQNESLRRGNAKLVFSCTPLYRNAVSSHP